MTYNEFILYRQEHYYFAKDNGLPIYSKDDLNSDTYEQNNEYMYNSLELQSYTSNIKTHQLEIKFTNLKMSFFVMPTTSKIKRDDYLEVGEGELQENYRVTGYDIQSSEGIEYVTIDPVYEYDLTPAPQQSPADNPEDYFWLNGGQIND